MSMAFDLFSKQRKRTSNLTLHASTVALTPVRAFTSYLRRHYHERYRGMYSLPGVVFFADALLVTIACLLLILDLFLLFAPPRSVDGGLEIRVFAPVLRASDLTPIEARIRSVDGKIHPDLSLRWQLPAWIEVVSAEPAFQKNGSVVFGDLVPGVERSSHVIVRIRAPKGTSVPLRFLIHQFDPFGLVSELQGQEVRPITSSVLTALPAVSSTRILSGGSVPILVKNESTTSVAAVLLRLSHHEGFPDASFEGRTSFPIGELKPAQEKTVFLDVGEASSSTVELGWELQDGAQVVDTEELHLNVAAAPGEGVIGLRDRGSASSVFPLTTSIRYYAEAGDQLGVGPLPPRIGQTTTYWVAWTIGPLEGSLKDLHLSTLLPEGVKATGKFAAPLDGAFHAEDRHVAWDIPFVSLAGNEMLTFAFEISLTPTSTMLGRSVLLMNESQAQATEAATGKMLTAVGKPQGTNLESDSKAHGQGIVQP